MKLLFLSSTKKREMTLAEMVCFGARKHGVRTEVSTRRSDLRNLDQFDAVAMVGVKSAKIWREAKRVGTVPIMFDKGYVRDKLPGHSVWNYWRVSIADHHPTAMLMNDAMPSDRFDDLRLDVKPWRDSRGQHVLIAGSSAKYHEFYDLPDPTAWARTVAKRLRKIDPTLPIIYRPKPSWKDAVHVPQTEFSGPKDKLGPILRRARAVVTHGSNISFEAALAGIPSIVLGNGVGAAIGSNDIAAITDPPKPDRKQWFANLAYWQWKQYEMSRGDMWEFIGPRLQGAIK